MRSRRGIWTEISVALMLIAAVGIAQQSTAQVIEHDRTQKVDRAATDQSTVRHDNAIDRADHGRTSCKASEVIGMKVRGLNGDKNIGSINDLMIDHDGHVTYAAVSFGGFLGMGDKLFAVPLQALEIVKNDNGKFARIDVTEETLKQKQGFNQENWPTEADQTFVNGNLRRQAAVPPVTR